MSSSTTEMWDLKNKQIESVEIPPMLVFTEHAIAILNQTIPEFLTSFNKCMWGDENNHGIYLEKDSFRFLRSDRLDDDGRLVYTGQGYIPAIVVQIEIGGTWYDVYIKYKNSVESTDSTGSQKSEN